jgi:hypothetical protein
VQHSVGDDDSFVAWRELAPVSLLALDPPEILAVQGCPLIDRLLLIE